MYARVHRIRQMQHIYYIIICNNIIICNMCTIEFIHVALYATYVLKYYVCPMCRPTIILGMCAIYNL